MEQPASPQAKQTAHSQQAGSEPGSALGQGIVRFCTRCRFLTNGLMCRWRCLTCSSWRVTAAARRPTWCTVRTAPELRPRPWQESWCWNSIEWRSWWKPTTASLWSVSLSHFSRAVTVNTSDMARKTWHTQTVITQICLICKNIHVNFMLFSSIFLSHYASGFTVKWNIDFQSSRQEVHVSSFQYNLEMSLALSIFINT